MDDESKPYAILAFDMELRRPGCAIVQRLLGGCVFDGESGPLSSGAPTNPASYFHADTWIVEMTANMKAYKIPTKGLFDRIVVQVEMDRRNREQEPKS